MAKKEKSKTNKTTEEKRKTKRPASKKTRSKSKKTAKTNKKTTGSSRSNPKTKSRAASNSNSKSRKNSGKKSSSVKTTAKKSVDKKNSENKKVKKSDTSGKKVIKKPKDTAPEHAPLKMRSKPRKHYKTGTKVFAALVAIISYCALMIVGAFYFNSKVIVPDKFPDSTFVNGVDVSNKDIKGAKAALTKEWNKHDISILEYGGSQIGEISKFDLEYDIDDQLDKAMKPGTENALKRFFNKDERKYTIEMKPLKSTKLFDKQFKALSIVKNAKGTHKSKNAYIDKSNFDFNIVKEVYGDTVDTKKLKQAIFRAIAKDENTFEFKKSSFYEAPEITSNSKVLLKELDYCKKYLSFKINYRNSVDDYVVPPSWLDKMMKVKDNEEVHVKKAKIKNFVESVIYPKFSSTGATRKLKSMGGGTYKVSGGTYGYTVDSSREVKRLKKELLKGHNVEREPFYTDNKAPSADEKNDIGKNFIEVSLGKQTLWVVRKGKVKVKTSIVSGNVAGGHATPTGTYYIVYKDTNTILRGENDDGSEYASPVSYWMPFYLGYGIHDASWRGAFGGSIYLSGGSHGCVNCPVSVMPKIFKHSYTGMPVIVH